MTLPYRRNIRMKKCTFMMLGLMAAASFAATASPLQQPTLSLSVANQLAAAAVQACQSKGYNVSVTVVDRAGLTRAVQRMDNAGQHTVVASYQKAYTSASTGMTSGKIMENAQKNPGAKHMSDIPGFLLLAGGVPVKSGDVTLGAIGVGGAPGGNLDEACALQALESVQDNL
jgi:uncharacterized protein GlcG (DUF336 family)